MKLESLELLPRGDNGWGSGILTFGQHTTLLLGPNGCGKTPIIKSLAYCLGHPVELPPLVREKCRAVRVVLFGSEGRCTLERNFATAVEVVATNVDGTQVNIGDERLLSEWVLAKLDISLRELSGKNGDKVPPYMSVVGPLFLVDQDTGWVTLYVPFEIHNFVKDQREEVIRWLLDVPTKNRPIDKSEFHSAKVTLEGIRERIAFKRRGLEDLQRELGEDRGSDVAQHLEDRRVSLEADLGRAYSALEGLSQAESALDSRIHDAAGRRDEIAFKLGNLKRRKSQLLDVQIEITAELGALEQNEVAADAFRALCGNETCQFFRTPEASYGRRVLYLKDQLKDFESSVSETERELGIIQDELSAAEATLQTATDDKTKSLANADGGAAISAVQAMTRELGDVRVRIDRLARIARERQQLDAMINNELRASEAVEELRPTGGPRKASSRLLDARQRLTATFNEWMAALRTPNVPPDVSFDEELRLIIGGERFSSRSSHSGSTRTRIVLAFHAALVEASLLMNGVHPRLLVLDAPRQHELSAADLRSYIERFYVMSTKHAEPVQLVFSATDPEVVPEGRVDALWVPTFEFNGEHRFLGRTMRSKPPSL